MNKFSMVISAEKAREITDKNNRENAESIIPDSVVEAIWEAVKIGESRIHIKVGYDTFKKDIEVLSALKTLGYISLENEESLSFYKNRKSDAMVEIIW